MRKIFTLTLLLTGLLLVANDQARACDCIGRVQGAKGVQTCGAYWGADAVFVGLAREVTIENGRMKVSFTVEKPIRGVSQQEVEVFTSASEASCGYPFKQGERYFVYGRGSDGKFSESLCGPTTLLKDAEDDLEYVKVLESGKLGTRIFGSILEDRQSTTKDKRTFDPLAGVEVTIKSEKRQFKTVTDEKGFYIFNEIPPDIYRVTAKFPAGVRDIDLRDHYAVVYRDSVRCDGENFVATRQGSIRGRVVDFPVGQIKNLWGPDSAQPKVSLFPLDDDDKIDQYRAPEERWAYRDKYEFFFETVPAGRYLLAINPYNCPYPNNGVPTMYFPGVAERADARIISLKESENLVLDDFRSLPLLKERWISGTVLNADKTPAVGATVRLTDARFGSGRCGNLNVEVKTDELGNFRVEGYETYEYKIEAYPENRNGQPRMYAKGQIIPNSGSVGSVQLILDQSF